ncbi:hypothetical protein FQZ97_806540 [compost metagenome]
MFIIIKLIYIDVHIITVFAIAILAITKGAVTEEAIFLILAGGNVNDLFPVTIVHSGKFGLIRHIVDNLNLIDHISRQVTGSH